MEIKEVRRLLSGRCSYQSQWEFDNFVIENYGEHRARAVHDLLVRLREIDDQMALLTPAMATRASDLAAERQQIETWLGRWSVEELEHELAQMEQQEERYWVERLGRQAVIDLLTQGRVSRETMTRAILLSEENYRRFVEVSGTIGRAVDTITREVEQAQESALPENMPR